METFAKGVHRVCVVDEVDNGKLLGVLTQSNVANFLYSKIARIPTASKSIRELKLVKGKVVSINSEAQV
jgi:CBS domain-containing protein